MRDPSGMKDLEILQEIKQVRGEIAAKAKRLLELSLVLREKVRREQRTRPEVRGESRESREVLRRATEMEEGKSRSYLMFSNAWSRSAGVIFATVNRTSALDRLVFSTVPEAVEEERARGGRR